jgi:hypothetical protein
MGHHASAIPMPSSSCRSPFTRAVLRVDVREDDRTVTRTYRPGSQKASAIEGAQRRQPRRQLDTTPTPEAGRLSAAADPPWDAVDTIYRQLPGLARRTTNKTAHLGDQERRWIIRPSRKTIEADGHDAHGGLRRAVAPSPGRPESRSFDRDESGRVRVTEHQAERVAGGVREDAETLLPLSGEATSA